MSSNHFVVSHHNSTWQFSHRGAVTAPFDTREEAVDAAIVAARLLSGEDIRVLVQNPDLKIETVWPGEPDAG